MRLIIFKTELLSARETPCLATLSHQRSSVWNQDKLKSLQVGCNLRNPKMACEHCLFLTSKIISDELSLKKTTKQTNQNPTKTPKTNKHKKPLPLPQNPKRVFRGKNTQKTPSNQANKNQQSVACPCQQCISKQATGKSQEKGVFRLQISCTQSQAREIRII